MKTLISPQEAFRLAFTNDEQLTPHVIAEADIAAAERRWIVPALGRQLHTRLLDHPDDPLVDTFLIPAAALFTRALIQPRLDIRTDREGTSSPGSSLIHHAGERAMLRLRRQLLREAADHLRAAADYIALHRDRYPEYRSQTAITCAGSIIFGAS